MWINLCGNMDMHKAIVLAQIALWVAVLVPGFSEKVLELRGVHIGGWGYLAALVGPVATLILCEACKVITGIQMRRYQRQLAKEQNNLDKEVPATLQNEEDKEVPVAHKICV